MAQEYALTLDSIDQAFAVWLAQQRYRPNTIRTYINAARHFRDWRIAKEGRATTPAKEKAALKRVTLSDLVHFQAEQPLMSASTHRARLSGLAKLLTWAGVNGDALINQLRQQKQPRRRQASVPAILSDSEEARLWEYLQSVVTARTPQRLRDAACVALVLSTGLRRSELCVLEVDHLNDQDGDLIVSVGDRCISIIDKVAAKVVGHWYEKQRRNGQSYFFTIAGSNDRSKKPSETFFNVIVKRVFVQAGLTQSAGSIQQLRNTCIVRQTEAGMGLSELTQRFGISAHSLARLANIG